MSLIEIKQLPDQGQVTQRRQLKLLNIFYIEKYRFPWDQGQVSSRVSFFYRPENHPHRGFIIEKKGNRFSIIG